MDESGVFALMDVFYRSSFDLGAAARALGDGEPRMIAPYKAELSPQDSGLSRVHLELLDSPISGGPPYLAGIEICFRRPLSISFPRLASLFGEAAEHPRRKPDQDRSIKVPVRGRERDGFALLTCTRETYQRDSRDVRRIILRRFPKQGEAAFETRDGGVEIPNAYPE